MGHAKIVSKNRHRHRPGYGKDQGAITVSDDVEERARFVLSRLQELRQGEGVTRARLAREHELLALIKIQNADLAHSFFHWAIDSLGANRKAQAARAALALAGPEDSNLTERRQRVADLHVHDMKSVKNWENQGLTDLAYYIVNNAQGKGRSLPFEVKNLVRIGRYHVNRDGLVTYYTALVRNEGASDEVLLWEDPVGTQMPTIMMHEPSANIFGNEVAINSFQIAWETGYPPYDYVLGRRGFTFLGIISYTPYSIIKERVFGPLTIVSNEARGTDPGNLGLVFFDKPQFASHKPLTRATSPQFDDDATDDA